MELDQRQSSGTGEDETDPRLALDEEAMLYLDPLTLIGSLHEQYSNVRGLRDYLQDLGDGTARVILGVGVPGKIRNIQITHMMYASAAVGVASTIDIVNEQRESPTLVKRDPEGVRKGLHDNVIVVADLLPKPTRQLEEEYAGARLEMLKANRLTGLIENSNSNPYYILASTTASLLRREGILRGLSQQDQLRAMLSNIDRDLATTAGVKGILYVQNRTTMAVPKGIHLLEGGTSRRIAAQKEELDRVIRDIADQESSKVVKQAIFTYDPDLHSGISKYYNNWNQPVDNPLWVGFVLNAERPELALGNSIGAVSLYNPGAWEAYLTQNREVAYSDESRAEVGSDLFGMLSRTFLGDYDPQKFEAVLNYSALFMVMMTMMLEQTSPPVNLAAIEKILGDKPTADRVQKKDKVIVNNDIAYVSQVMIEFADIISHLTIEDLDEINKLRNGEILRQLSNFEAGNQGIVSARAKSRIKLLSIKHELSMLFKHGPSSNIG